MNTRAQRSCAVVATAMGVMLGSSCGRKGPAAPLEDLGVVEKDDAGMVVRVSLPGPEITDEHLVALEGMTALRHLHLKLSQTTDAGLEHVSNCTGLHKLHLAGTHVTDDGLRHLGQLANLQTLYVSDTRIEGTGFSDLVGLQRLSRLFMADSAVNDGGMAEIGRLERLTVLSLSRTRVSDAGLSHLAQLAALRELQIDDTVVTDVGVASLGRAARGLESLDVSGLKLGSDAMRGLARLPNLKTLKLGRVNVSDAMCAIIASMPALEQLWLEKAGISGPGLGKLGSLRKLSWLVLSGSSAPPDAIGQFRVARPRVTVMAE